MCRLRVYLDANIFLHFHQPDQIDWCDLYQEQKIELVVCMPVIHELDRKKADPLLSERARKALAFIEQHSDSDEDIRDSVSLTVDYTEVCPQEMAAPLVHAVVDDQVIFLVQSEAARAVRIMLVSDDTGMRLKAKRGGIQVTTPDEKYRLDNPKDPIQKKLNRANDELERLKSRKGKFDVHIASLEKDEWGPVCQFPCKVERQIEIGDALAEVRKRYPKRDVPHSILAMSSSSSYHARLDHFYNE